MIRIGNKLWRTLKQPILADGKVVKEAWINNKTLVYPEGEFVKLRAELKLEGITHEHPAVPEYDPKAYFAGGQTPWSLTCRGAVIIKRRSSDESRIVDIETYRLPAPTDIQLYSDRRHQMNLYSSIQTTLMSPMAFSYGDMYDSKAWGTNDGWSTGNYDLIAAKLKFRCDPLPVCGPFRQWLNGRSNYRTYVWNNETLRGDENKVDVTCWFDTSKSPQCRTYSFSSGGTVNGPSEFNNRVFSSFPDESLGELPFNQWLSDQYAGTDYDRGTKVEVGRVNMFIAATYPYSFALTRYEYNPGDSTEDEIVTDLGTCYSVGGIGISVPYTAVLYAGPEDEATEEDMTITDEDLDLDSV